MYAEGTDVIGTVLCDRYRILDLIGDGGMGRVYAAEHIALRRKVAVKLLKPDLARVESYVDRFLQEARAASMIVHPNVVDILDFGRIPGGPVFFAMEFLDGEDLAHLLRREGRLNWPRIQHISLQIARGLQAAHQCGVIHRDLKPANMFLIRRGHEADYVKLLDFGIAQVRDGDGRGRLTSEGSVFGTAAYMSPEQAAGQSVDARSDVYSLGLLIYEMLTGRVPFDGDNFLRVASQQIHEPVPPPREFAPEAGISPIVEQLVMRALEKDPNRRYATMADFEAAMMAVSFDATVAVMSPLRSEMPPSAASPAVDQTVIYAVDGAHPASSGPPLEQPVVEATVVRPRPERRDDRWNAFAIQAAAPPPVFESASDFHASPPPLGLSGGESHGSQDYSSAPDPFAPAMPSGFGVPVGHTPSAHRTLPPVNWHGHNASTGEATPGPETHNTHEFALNIPRQEVSRNWLVIAISAAALLLCSVAGFAWFFVFADDRDQAPELHPAVTNDKLRPAQVTKEVAVPEPKPQQPKPPVSAPPRPPEPRQQPRAEPEPEPRPVKAEKAEPVAKLSDRDISQGFRRAASAIKKCGSQHGAIDGTRFSVTFDIADGRASNVAVQRPHNITALGRCVADAVQQQARFRKAQMPTTGATQYARF